jgi:hypothetical protein
MYRINDKDGEAVGISILFACSTWMLCNGLGTAMFQYGATILGQ